MKNSFTDFGWIDSIDNKIVPKLSTNAKTDICIGIGIIMLGVGYLTYKTFYNGARAHEQAELDVLDNLGKLL